MNSFRYLYLHGFGSSRDSEKGLQLRHRLAPAGIELELLDVNRPTFETQTYSAILAHLDEIDRGTGDGVRLRIAGSSMGGYLAARWAELHPERVDRLFLLCPGFDLAARWPLMVGDEAMRAWERDGELEVAASGTKRSLHWQFVIDSRGHPAFPEVPCPTCIVHGTQDEVVPVEFSREYGQGRGHVRLVELTDNHLLHDSVARIGDEMLRHFA